MIQRSKYQYFHWFDKIWPVSNTGPMTAFVRVKPVSHMGLTSRFAYIRLFSVAVKHSYTVWAVLCWTDWKLIKLFWRLLEYYCKNSIFCIANRLYLASVFNKNISADCEHTNFWSCFQLLKKSGSLWSIYFFLFTANGRRKRPTI
jgi:hypothetical protein